MRELVYYVASSLDGFIAAENGSLDGFIWDDDYVADLRATFPETFPVHLRGDEAASRADNRWFDAVLMGRKTYELGLTDGVTSPYPTLDQYVFSRKMGVLPDPDVELVKTNAPEAVGALKQQEGKAIWLCGGGSLAATLLGANLIDRLIIKLNPVLFGSGIPLVAGTPSSIPIELTHSKRYHSGHLVLHYRMRGT